MKWLIRVYGTDITVRADSRAAARQIALKLSRERPGAFVVAEPPAAHYGLIVCRWVEVLPHGTDMRIADRVRWPKGRSRKPGIFGRVRKIHGRHGVWWGWWVEQRRSHGGGAVLQSGIELRECDARAVLADELAHQLACAARRRAGPLR